MRRSYRPIRLLSKAILPLVAFVTHMVSAENLSILGFDLDKDGSISTTEFQKAIDSARSLRGTLFLPSGIYNVYKPLMVSEGSFDACRIMGENTRGVIIRSHLEGNQPVFSFKGGWGEAGNAGLSDLSIESAEGFLRQGTGIYIDGLNFGIFNNIHLRRLKYAVWLHNDTPDPDPKNPDNSASFSEMNQFSHLWIKECSNGIRMQQGLGQQSFHGNGFEDIFMDIYANDTGFNQIGGYYYNGNFQLHLWGHGSGVVYLNADGKAEHNSGVITYESQDIGDGAGPKLKGTGKFWYHGQFHGLGKIDDLTMPRNKWTKVVACDNYWKQEKYAGTEFSAGPLPTQNRGDNGPLGMFQSFSKNDVNSVVLNTYNNSADNGLYLGTSGYQMNETESKLGMFLAGDGSRIKTWSKNGLSIEAQSLKVMGDMEVGQDGYQVITGTVVLPGRSSVKSDQPTRVPAPKLTYQNFLSGRIVMWADVKEGNAPSSTYEIHAGAAPGSGKIVPFMIIPGGKLATDTLIISFGAGSRELSMGFNLGAKVRDIHFVFTGVRQ